MADYDENRLQFEINKRKKIEQKLKQRLAFEKTISIVSSRFIAVKNIKTAINYTLRDIGRLSGASRAYIFFFSEDGKTMSNTHEWCRKGISPQIKNLQDIPSNSLPWWVAQLRKGNTIHITDVSKMPKAAKATQKLLKSQDIKSLLVIPLYKEGKLVGFAGFDDVAKAGEWNDDDLMLLRICSDIVTKAFESKVSEDKLRESETQFRVLAEENPNMIFIHNTNHVVYANKRCVELMGYTKKEFCSKDFDFMILIAPEFKQEVKKRFIQQLNGHSVKSMDYTILTKNGKRIEAYLATKLIKYQGKTAILGIITDITERKEAEKQIRESEAKFKVLAEENPNLIFIYDFKCVAYLNKRSTEVLGYTPEESYSKNFNFMKTIAPESRSKIKENLIKHSKGIDVEPYEVEFITKEGKKVDTLFFTKLMEYKGKPAVFGIIVDITERKKAENQIRESEAQFKVLAEENPNMIFIHDMKHLRYANKRGVEVMGYTLEEGYSRNFDYMKLIAPESRSKIKENIMKHSKGKEVKPYEAVFITKKGKKVAVLLSTKLIEYKGKPAIFGIITDITERKKAEDALKESEAKFRILFNTAKDAIFINDKTGRFLDVNKAACKSLGYTKDELLKLSNKDIDDEPTGYQEFKKLRDGKIKESKFEMKQRRKDGTYNQVEIVGSRLESKDQQIFMAVARDITERKKAEAQIKEYAEKLETKVKERTEKLSKTNQELSERVDELERFHNVTVGRELKMIELKEQIKKLENKLK